MICAVKTASPTSDISRRTIHKFFPHIGTHTATSVGDPGVALLSEALKINTTLTELNVAGEHKSRVTPK